LSVFGNRALVAARPAYCQPARSGTDIALLAARRAYRFATRNPAIDCAAQIVNA